jgi:hypothetical protein
LQAIFDPGISGGSVHLSLFVAGLVVTEAGVLLKRLSDAAHIPVPKNTKYSREKGLFYSVAFHVLLLEESNQRLGHGHPESFIIGHILSFVDSRSFFQPERPKLPCFHETYYLITRVKILKDEGRSAGQFFEDCQNPARPATLFQYFSAR